MVREETQESTIDVARLHACTLGSGEAASCTSRLRYRRYVTPYHTFVPYQATSWLAGCYTRYTVPYLYLILVLLDKENFGGRQYKGFTAYSISCVPRPGTAASPRWSIGIYKLLGLKHDSAAFPTLWFIMLVSLCFIDDDVMDGRPSGRA